MLIRISMVAAQPLSGWMLIIYVVNQVESLSLDSGEETAHI
jgi:hypothetical protein